MGVGAGLKPAPTAPTANLPVARGHANDARRPSHLAAPHFDRPVSYEWKDEGRITGKGRTSPTGPRHTQIWT